jgi:hypothetical protein
MPITYHRTDDNVIEPRSSSASKSKLFQIIIIIVVVGAFALIVWFSYRASAPTPLVPTEGTMPVQNDASVSDPEVGSLNGTSESAQSDTVAFGDVMQNQQESEPTMDTSDQLQNDTEPSSLSSGAQEPVTTNTRDSVGSTHTGSSNPTNTSTGSPVGSGSGNTNTSSNVSDISTNSNTVVDTTNAVDTTNTNSDNTGSNTNSNDDNSNDQNTTASTTPDSPPLDEPDEPPENLCIDAQGQVILLEHANTQCE